MKGFSDVQGHAFFVVVGVESIFTDNQLAHHVQKAGFGRIFERFEQVPLQIFISDVRLDGHQQVVNSARRSHRKSEGRGEKSLNDANAAALLLTCKRHPLQDFFPSMLSAFQLAEKPMLQTTTACSPAAG